MTSLQPSRMARVEISRRAFELLAEHPLLGRVAENGRRELVLARGHYGYFVGSKVGWFDISDDLPRFQEMPV